MVGLDSSPWALIVWALIVWALALCGHFALCLAVFNRIHAAGLPYWLNRVLDKIFFLLILGGFGCWAYLGFGPPDHWPHLLRILSASFPLAVYAVLCLEMACFMATVWLIRRVFERPPTQLASNDTKSIDVVKRIGERPVGHWTARLLDVIPGNQMFDLEVHEKTLRLSCLPLSLDGFSIAHLSDLHFTGKVARSYFECMVDETLELNADMIAITGDLFDHPDCLEWADSMLSRLESRLGVYYILGNHERRMKDPATIRATLDDLGFVDVSRAAVTVEVEGCNVLVAGNERPWFRGTPELRPAALMEADLRILLSHSPDQLRWAQRRQFDLMLAGHTHGGQIRLPVIGPVVAPSNYGVRYASGTFFEPPVLMHVTRGVSGKMPLRINCRPEISKLTLRAE